MIPRGYCPEHREPRCTTGHRSPRCTNRAPSTGRVPACGRVAPDSWRMELPSFAVLGIALIACVRPSADVGIPPRETLHPLPADSSSPSPAPSALEQEIIHVRSRLLVVPVAGVTPEQIPDSYLAARGSRTHNAIDILAPRGTPVISADEGRVLKLRSNASGGITIYATDPSGRIVYYYAHLERYRHGLAEGAAIAKGDTIGHVGTTGNAPAGVPHLHFQVTVMHAQGKYWAGIPVDPRPFTALARTASP